mmetsp:Transcript_57866/g.62523  ORF Transcript_57866/g.62523 Transcript_57866/m.62523 type:complete len:575 (-) Transcript_57866:91-1815(-)
MSFKELSLATLADHISITNLSAAAVIVSFLFTCSVRINNKKKIAAGDTNTVKTPLHVRSYVPILGSALEMSKNIRKFIDKYSTKYNEPIFTAKIGNDHCLFIGDPDHVMMTYRYPKQLNAIAVQTQFTRNVLGIDHKKEHLMFHTEFAKEASKHYHKYLFSGPELSKTIQDAQRIFVTILPKLVIGGEEKEEYHQHDLYTMVRNCIFKASVEPLISKHLATNEAAALFQEFGKGIPLMMFGEAPSFLVKKLVSAQNSLLDMINHKRFLQQGSDLIKARHSVDWDQFDIGGGAFSRGTLGLTFAAVGNSIPVVFWMLYHIIENKDAYEKIQQEVQKVLHDKKQQKLKESDNDDSNSNSNNEDDPSLFTLQELDQMVYLKSAFTEALWMYQGVFATKDVVTDFVFDPKKKGQSKYFIKKGTRIMAFVATRHYDPDIFDHPETYQYDRFAPTIVTTSTTTTKKDSDDNDDSHKDETVVVQKLVPPVFTKNGKRVLEPVRAFGGGSHLCPGRKFIAFEIQAFVALLITKFDMKLVGSMEGGGILDDNNNRPEIDYSMQGVGISHPNKDVVVEIRLKKE